MSYDWGPYYIVPSSVLKSYAGIVVLRENFDKGLLQQETQMLGIDGPVVKAVNPWYYRKKGTETWIKIGESADEHHNFATRWDTTNLENGKYEVMGLMHVSVKRNGSEVVIARQNIAEVEIQN